MKSIYIACLSLLLFASKSLAFNYLPKPVAGNQQLTYSQFTLSYELTAEEVVIDRDRCDCFGEDESITSGSAQESDYASTGFDKGHLSPAEANKATEQANRESFLMTNMSPQLPKFNRGIWKKLEAMVANAAEGYGKIYVVSGPVFMNNLGKIGENDVTIPGYFFKVLLRFEGDKAIATAFMIPQVNATGELKEYTLPINALESITGIDFFPELDDSIENKVESRYSIESWDRLIFR